MSIKLIAVDMDGTFLSDAKTYNLAALPRPVPANARTEYSLRGRQRQPILSADLLFPGDRPSDRLRGGKWRLGGERQ